MKKPITLALLLWSFFSAQAQTSFEATEQYGKLYDLTYDATIPNRIYAITLSNHIVSSDDNGLSWHLFFSSPSGEYMRDLKLLPGNAGLSFSVGSGVGFIDIATQQLTHYFQVPPSNVAGAGPSTITSYSVYDAQGTTLLFDTVFQIGFANFGKTFYTSSSANTWNEVYYTINHDNVFVNNVAISPDNPDKLFLARGNGDSDVDGGIWISTDAGANFTESISGVTLDPIAFHPVNPQEILVGSSIGFGVHPENLYKSHDGGLTWTIVPITWNDQTLNNITTIKYCPQDPNSIIVLDENEILTTLNGGASWTQTVYPVGESMQYYYGLNASFNPANKDQIAIGTDFYPQFTMDGGASLTQIKAKFYNVISTAVVKESDVTHLYYGAQGGRVHKNMDTGDQQAYDTELVNSFNPKRNFIYADPNVPGRVFTFASLGFFGGAINVSTDYGATATDIYPAFADDIQELKIDPNNNNIIYISLRSGEAGSMIKLDISDLNNVISTDIFTPYVGEGVGVVTGIVINPANSNEIYISKYDKVFKSTDGGENWIEKSNGLEAISNSGLIWDMTQNPLDPTQLTLSSNVGIFTSYDSAETWTSLMWGNVYRVKHSPLNNGVLVGTVHANSQGMVQIHYSVDGGQNWETVSEETLNYLQGYWVDYLFENDTIECYIATSDLGVVKYVIEDLQLGTHQPVGSNPIALYPNPASETVNVGIDAGELVSAQIWSVTGQKIMETTSPDINVSSLSNGVYFVRINTTANKTFTSKLVKE